jgi:hypothetical protein
MVVQRVMELQQEQAEAEKEGAALIPDTDEQDPTTEKETADAGE